MMLMMMMGQGSNTNLMSNPMMMYFLMKDGNTRAYVGSSHALISEIADVTFNGSDPVSWNSNIDGTWTFMSDDGEVSS